MITLIDKELVMSYHHLKFECVWETSICNLCWCIWHLADQPSHYINQLQTPNSNKYTLYQIHQIIIKQSKEEEEKSSLEGPKSNNQNLRHRQKQSIPIDLYHHSPGHCHHQQWVHQWTNFKKIHPNLFICLDRTLVNMNKLLFTVS